MDNNNFTISIPSVPVKYGDDWYESYPYDEGIKFAFCEDLNFTNNKIGLQYSSYATGADTINVVSVRNIFVDTDANEDYSLLLEGNRDTLSHPIVNALSEYMDRQMDSEEQVSSDICF